MRASPAAATGATATVHAATVPGPPGRGQEDTRRPHLGPLAAVAQRVASGFPGEQVHGPAGTWSSRRYMEGAERAERPVSGICNSNIWDLLGRVRGSCREPLHYGARPAQARAVSSHLPRVDGGTGGQPKTPEGLGARSPKGSACNRPAKSSWVLTNSLRLEIPERKEGCGAQIQSHKTVVNEYHDTGPAAGAVRELCGTSLTTTKWGAVSLSIETRRPGLGRHVPDHRARRRQNTAPKAEASNPILRGRRSRVSYAPEWASDGTLGRSTPRRHVHRAGFQKSIPTVSAYQLSLNHLWIFACYRNISKTSVPDIKSKKRGKSQQNEKKHINQKLDL